jgi:ribonuclease P/MRP protein subunit RPP40
VLKWVDSYLTDRIQVVRLNGKISEPLKCNIGVPQGSVLGPLLFIADINDMHLSIKFCKINLFADDTFLYIVGSDLPTMCRQINEDLQRLLQYCQGNKLKVDLEKFQCMLITTSK